MASVKFTKTIQRFGKNGEKTGWTYVLIDARFARRMNPGTKVSFRIKGTLDHHPVRGVSILPMGKGDYILPLNASMRKAIGKKDGDKLELQLELDTKKPLMSADLLKCLKEDPIAWKHFKNIARLAPVVLFQMGRIRQNHSNQDPANRDGRYVACTKAPFPGNAPGQ